MEAIRRLRRLLTDAEKGRLRRVVALSLVVAVLESLTVLSILPLTAAVTDPGSVLARPELQWLTAALDVESPRGLILVLGSTVLALLVITNVLATANLRLIHLTAWNINHFLACRLLAAYLGRPYEWYLTRNTSRMHRHLLDEARATVQGVLLPLLVALARGTGAVLMVAVLLAVNVRLTLLAGVVLGGAYVAIYRGIHRWQERLGSLRVEANQSRFQLAAEALGGIKEVKTLGAEAEFQRRFEDTGPSYVRSMAWTNVISEMPRHVLEVLAIGSVIALLVGLALSGSGLDETLPLLAVFAFAGYRMVPSFQVVFSGLNRARFHLPSLRELEEELGGGQVSRGTPPEPVPPMGLRHTLELRDVTYRYPDTSRPALDAVDLTLRVGERVGLVGPTGSGKTTLADVVLGLLAPESGSVVVDGVALDEGNRSAWRSSVGYVPQSIFLSDDTVQANIALGIPPHRVDPARVRAAARQAGIADVIDDLSQGYETRVGERGVRLSGGQRQRIGIARALYRTPSLLLLDEATSALDVATERGVADAIFDLEGERITLIIAHRLATVRRCDRIVVMEGGRITGLGSWDELHASHDLFRLLVRLGGGPSDPDLEG